MTPISKKWEGYLSDEEEEDYAYMMVRRHSLISPDLVNASASIRHLDRSISKISTKLHQLESELFELMLRKENEDKEFKRELIDVRCVELTELIDEVKSVLDTLKEWQSDAVEDAESCLFN